MFEGSKDELIRLIALRERRELLLAELESIEDQSAELDDLFLTELEARDCRKLDMYGYVVTEKYLPGKPDWERAFRLNFPEMVDELIDKAPSRSEIRIEEPK